MAQKNLATKSRISNLGGWAKKTPKPTAKNVPQDKSLAACPDIDVGAHSHLPIDDPVDHELAEFVDRMDGAWPELPDDDQKSDDEMESDNENLDEITEITALDHFSMVLQRAQKAGVTAERERDKGSKRPRVYKGGSVRTRQRWEKKRTDLAKKGFPSISNRFSEARPPVPVKPATVLLFDEIQSLREEEEESESNIIELGEAYMSGVQPHAQEEEESDNSESDDSGMPLFSNLQTFSQGFNQR